MANFRTLNMPAALLLLTAAAAAHAESPQPEPEPPADIAHAFSAGMSASNHTLPGGVLGYRLRLEPHLQLGIEIDGGWARKGFIAGYPVTDGGTIGGDLFVQGTVLREGPLWLDLRGGAGVRQLLGAEAPAISREASGLSLDGATSLLAHTAVIANVEAGPWLTVRVGVLTPFAIQLAPEAGLETMGLLPLAGLAVHVSEAVSLTADGYGGGVFGFDGDGEKVFAAANSVCAGSSAAAPATGGPSDAHLCSALFGDRAAGRF